VRWQNRINSLCFVGCLSFIETEHHISARFVLRDFHKALNRCILQRPIFLSWFVRQEEASDHIVFRMGGVLRISASQHEVRTTGPRGSAFPLLLASFIEDDVCTETRADDESKPRELAASSKQIGESAQ